MGVRRCARLFIACALLSCVGTLMLALGSCPLALAVAENAVTSEDQANASVQTPATGDDAGKGAQAEDGAADASSNADDTTSSGQSGVGVTSSAADSAQSGASNTSGDASVSSDSNATPSKSATASHITTTVTFVGPDGEWARVGGLAVNAGSNAWDATLAALRQSGMPYDTESSPSADVIVSLAPDDASQPCVVDMSLGNAWHLYIQGEQYEGAAATYTVKEGDVLEWRFEVGTLTVSVSVVGPGGTGLDYWISPTDVEVDATQSAWDASHVVFEQNGFSDGRLLSYTVAADGAVYLESLASLGENGLTGERWQVFVNGSLPEVNIALLPLRAGDSICWYYAGNGEGELPQFAAKTGAASQNPATTVWVDGSVAQEWTRSVGTAKASSARQHAMPDVLVLGREGTWSLTASPASLSDSLGVATTVAPRAGQEARGWSTSLACLMDGKVLRGQGGRATMSADGSLYYLDNSGLVVKLSVE